MNRILAVKEKLHWEKVMKVCRRSDVQVRKVIDRPARFRPSGLGALDAPKREGTEGFPQQHWRSIILLLQGDEWLQNGGIESVIKRQRQRFRDEAIQLKPPGTVKCELNR